MADISFRGFLIMGLILIVIVLFSNFIISLNIPPTRETSMSEISAVNLILKKLDVEKKDWKTIVLSTSERINVPREKIWKEFINTNDWTKWSNEMYGKVKWKTEEKWEKGTKFEQEMRLGFPLGTKNLTEEIYYIKEGYYVGYYRNEVDYISYTYWKFDEISKDETVIIAVQVLNGFSVGMLKPLVLDRWRENFKDNVNKFSNYLTLTYK